MVRILVVVLALLSSAFGQNRVSQLEQQFHLVPDNALAVLIVRPSQMLEAKSLASNPLADLAGPTGIKPSQVDRLIVAAIPTGPPSFDTGMMCVIEFKEAVAPETLKRTLSPRAAKLDDWPFPTFDGQSYPARLSACVSTAENLGSFGRRRCVLHQLAARHCKAGSTQTAAQSDARQAF